MRYVILFLLSFPAHAAIATWDVEVHKSAECLTQCAFPDLAGDVLLGTFTVADGTITHWHFSLDAEFIYPASDAPICAQGNDCNSAEFVSPTHAQFIHAVSPFSTTQVDLDIPAFSHGTLITATVLAAGSQLWFSGSGRISQVPESSSLLMLAVALQMLWLRRPIARSLSGYRKRGFHEFRDRPGES